MRIFRFALLLAGVALAFGTPSTSAQSKSSKRPVTRLFIQDEKSGTLKWLDVRQDAKGKLSLSPLVSIAGFPKLDPERQKLVQMRESKGLLCVGVRDDKDGTHQSGWVLLRTGVGYTEHGDHGHWDFKKKPAVVDSRLDDKQGNPAHLYLYDGRFYLANDKLNGYTRIDPAKYEGEAKDTPRFLVGGGNHITLAVVEDKVGYSAWIDGGGPNKGRVDVTPVTDATKTEPAYSFQLPTGGIHGAIAAAGKVFFAPSEGICWVEADPTLSRKPADVKIHHIDLGKDDDKPRRTGAFTRHKNWVLFVTGKEANASLVLLDAKQAEPKPITVPLHVKKGCRALTPAVVTTPEGKTYALIFHDHAKGAEVEDALQIVELDPNGDDDCSDAKVVHTLKIGNSAVEGHFGHHDVAFDADGRLAFFTNPGDGTLSVLSLKTMTVVETFNIGGQPGAIVAHGGIETDD
jgi:hypothetical protein